MSEIAIGLLVLAMVLAVIGVVLWSQRRKYIHTLFWICVVVMLATILFLLAGEITNAIEGAMVILITGVTYLARTRKDGAR